jgi:hypothetical protein
MRSLVLPCVVALGCSSGDDVQAPATHTVSLAMDSFAVAPGQEVWKCQDFANPFGGDAQVVRWRSHMSRGSHHLLVSLHDAAVNTGVTDCTGANLDGQVFDSQGLDSETLYPDGIAFEVPAGSGFRLEAHYLNAEDAAFDGAVTMEADVDDSGEPRTAAGPLLFTTGDITIPPATDTTITHTCTVAHDLSLFDAVSHMHKHGTHFVASAGDRVLYETYTYDHPPRSTFDPPIELHAGDVVTFSCSYRNTGTTTITFGQSADRDEMCALFGSYYPVPDGAQPFLTCFDGGGPPPM